MPGAAGADLTKELGGLAGSLFGVAPAQQKAKIAEATKTANDLTGLIRKKQPKAETQEAAAPAENGAAKRKLEDDGNVEKETRTNGKKVKFEDGAVPGT